MKLTKWLAGFILLFLLSCNQHYVNSLYPIPDKKLFKQQVYYTSKYGYIATLTDTMIKDRKICRTYSQGILQKIGKVDGVQPIGYWFVFKDSLTLEYIVKYGTHKIDSFYHPFAIVNQRW